MLPVQRQDIETSRNTSPRMAVAPRVLGRVVIAIIIDTFIEAEQWVGVCLAKVGWLPFASKIPRAACGRTTRAAAGELQSRGSSTRVSRWFQVHSSRADQPTLHRSAALSPNVPGGGGAHLRTNWSDRFHPAISNRSTWLLAARRAPGRAVAPSTLPRAPTALPL